MASIQDRLHDLGDRVFQAVVSRSGVPPAFDPPGLDPVTHGEFTELLLRLSEDSDQQPDLFSMPVWEALKAVSARNKLGSTANAASPAAQTATNLKRGPYDDAKVMLYLSALALAVGSNRSYTPAGVVPELSPVVKKVMHQAESLHFQLATFNEVVSEAERAAWRDFTGVARFAASLKQVETAAQQLGFTRDRRDHVSKLAQIVSTSSCTKVVRKGSATGAGRHEGLTFVLSGTGLPFHLLHEVVSMYATMTLFFPNPSPVANSVEELELPSAFTLLESAVQTFEKKNSLVHGCLSSTLAMARVDYVHAVKERTKSTRAIAALLDTTARRLLATSNDPDAADAEEKEVKGKDSSPQTTENAEESEAKPTAASSSAKLDNFAAVCNFNIAAVDSATHVGTRLSTIGGASPLGKPADPVATDMTPIEVDEEAEARPPFEVETEWLLDTFRNGIPGEMAFSDDNTSSTLRDLDLVIKTLRVVSRAPVAEGHGTGVNAVPLEFLQELLYRRTQKDVAESSGSDSAAAGRKRAREVDDDDATGGGDSTLVERQPRMVLPVKVAINGSYRQSTVDFRPPLESIWQKHNDEGTWSGTETS